MGYYLCSPNKCQRIVRQKRERTYHSILKFIHETAAALHDVNSSFDLTTTKTD